VRATEMPKCTHDDHGVHHLLSASNPTLAVPQHAEAAVLSQVHRQWCVASWIFRRCCCEYFGWGLTEKCTRL
jgi:hypothetical protein